MTLHEFRSAEKITLAALAARLGRPISTVHGWVTGARKPGWDDIPAIERATDGRVTAADFVPRQPAEAA